MNRILLEILRRKRIVIAIILSLTVLNVILVSVIASYQEPKLEISRSKWIELRRLVARAGHADALSLHRQGIVDLEKLNTRIPPKREFARLISDILQAASDSGVTTGSISYKPLQIKDEALLSYKLTMAASGDYAAVKSYLSDLQQNRELIVVDSVSLENSDLFSENVVMNMSITIYLREGA
jgi:type IV pilus assembly protein PilO